jgi:hypothetical protein
MYVGIQHIGIGHTRFFSVFMLTSKHKASDVCIVRAGTPGHIEVHVSQCKLPSKEVADVLWMSYS